jgi:predicted Zn-dependent peptidase
MIKRTVLDSGLTIITEYRATVSTFALSYTLKSGSRAETTVDNGIHHLMEHMLFKGSGKYDLKQIAEVSDRLGGTLNAFTGKEVTQYYMTAIDEKLEESFDLLTDIVMESVLPADELEKEKNVVVQEIKETEDTPDSYSFDLFYEQVFDDNGMGLPIAGHEDQVSAMDRPMVNDFYKRQYAPHNLILAAVGKVDHDRLVALAERYFSRFSSRKAVDFTFPTTGYSFDTQVKVNDSLNQVYALIGLQAPSFGALDKFKYKVMNNILGSGMSSRLFQSIREDKGLAYTVSSFPDFFLEGGLCIIYSITEPGNVKSYLQAVQEEIDRLKKDGVDERELEWARDYAKGSLVLQLESNANMMRFHVNQELYLPSEKPVRSILDEVDSITVDDVNGMIRDYLDLERSAILLYGNMSPEEYGGFRFE